MALSKWHQTDNIIFIIIIIIFIFFGGKRIKIPQCKFPTKKFQR